MTDLFHGLPITERRLEDQETQVKARELLDISKAVEATHPDPHEMTEDQLEELRASVEDDDAPLPKVCDEQTTLLLMILESVRRTEDRIEVLEKGKLPVTDAEKIKLRRAMGNFRLSWPKSGQDVHEMLVRAYGEY